MRIANVDFPEPILSAQSNDELVIFAGAGISVDSPSNLPTFEGFSDQIAEGILTRKESDPIDRFLGRLKEHNISVHLRAQDIYGNTESKPNRLHYAILSLFSSLENVRIVTTNFDQHLSSVASELFRKTLDTFFSPALPLGRDFNGIVYLHGSASKKPENLILTDADFAKAYLTDGWATRFLVELFSKWTVLFVGYSHDDLIMRYLARGLTPGTRRFALTKPGKDWECLGIVPIIYQGKDGTDHSNLTIALEAWAGETKRGALEHEHRIKDIVAVDPPLDPENSDYIEHSLKDLTRVRFFTRYARKVEWLYWAGQKGAFKKLLQISEPIDDISKEFASWFANNFVCQYVDESLAFIQSNNLTLNPLLWDYIAHVLAYKNPKPPSPVFAKWVPVLLASVQQNCRLDLLGHLLIRSQYPDDKTIALLLFEYLAKPSIELRQHISFFEEKEGKPRLFDVEIKFSDNGYSLKQAWTNILKPNLKFLYGEIILILTLHLIKAHNLLVSMGCADNYYDPLSFSRPSIEQHPQNMDQNVIDILIDASRDLIEWLIANKKNSAKCLLEEWLISDVPLLKRLVIHGITEDPSLNPNEKISWLLDNNMIFHPGMKHETFRLLQKVYAGTNKKTKLNLLENIIGSANRKSKESKYEIYNLLYWLHSNQPSCPLAKRYFNKMQKVNSNFKPRENPDFDFWISHTVGLQSPVSIEELLKWNIEEKLEWMLCYNERNIVGPDREGLLSAIRAAVTRSFDWGMKLAEELEKKKLWDSDIWDSVLQGWAECSLTESQWCNVLSLIFRCSFIHKKAYEISEILEGGIRKHIGKMPYSSLDLAESIAEKVIAESSKASNKEGKKACENWLNEAINQPGGKLAEFLIQGLLLRYKECKDTWKSIPDFYKRTFQLILKGDFYEAEMGCVILASQLLFLLAIDQDWTRENIITLFDWNNDPKKALKAWNGYLVLGRWNEALIQIFWPYFEQTFSNLQSFHPKIRKIFCEWIAAIAIYSSIDPMGKGWIKQFIVHADPDSRKMLASEIGHVLRSLEPEAIKTIWNKWLKFYWSQRVKDIPIPLDDGEKEEMIPWVINLEPVLIEAIDIICNIIPPPLIHTNLFYKLLEKNFANRHPVPLARLLRHLLSVDYDPFLHCEQVEALVKNIIPQSVPREDLLSICDRLSSLGCPNALSLKQEVDKNKIEH